MKTERLRSWQPDATDEQLAEFVRENKMVLDLLDDCWQKFRRARPNLFQAAAPQPQSSYAQGFSVDDLAHFPVSPQELAAFAEAFDRKNGRGCRPLGDHPPICDQDWELAQ